MLFLVISIALISQIRAESAHKIIAETQSGRTFEATTVDLCDTFVRLGPAPDGTSIADPVVYIRGLGELPNLTELSVLLFSQIASYEFLEGVPGIRSLTISLCRLENLDFLRYLPELRHLHIDSCRNAEIGSILPDRKLDLSSNPNIQTIIFHNCGFTVLPKLIGVPESLRRIDLSVNEMTVSVDDFEVLDGYRSIETVVLWGNDVEDAVFDRYANIEKTE